MAAGAVSDFLEHGESQGIMVPVLHHPALDENRAAPRIRSAFAQLWGTADLQVTIDGGGFNPVGGTGQNLHWDTSLAPPIPLNIQGILYLTDTPAEQGAFRCVPGFHRRIESWLAGLPPDADPRTQDLTAQAVPIPGKAGDFILWHAALPHGAGPNQGTCPRITQYVAYYPPGRADNRDWV
jgi:ectoine hydroxylase-related dioxygenase (phytanoyl-CoA dioxygenase family)